MLTITSDILVKDAAQKQSAYHGLSKHYATNGDGWSALHALLISDMSYTTLLLLKSEYDLENQLNEIRAEITKRNTSKSNLSPIKRANLIREAIHDSLPKEIRKEWKQGLLENAFLSPLKNASPETTKNVTAARFGGLTVEDFCRYKETQAQKALIDSRDRFADGLIWGSVTSEYEGDLAAFETWIFHNAAQTGDTSYVQAEMRWLLAVSALADLTLPDTDPEWAKFLVRSRLAWALGPVDASDFARYLSKL